MDSSVYNPTILAPEVAATASTHELLVAIYYLVFSATALFFACVVYFIVFRSAVWFLPKVWRVKGEKV